MSGLVVLWMHAGLPSEDRRFKPVHGYFVNCYSFQQGNLNRSFAELALLQLPHVLLWTVESDIVTFVKAL